MHIYVLGFFFFGVTVDQTTFLIVYPVHIWTTLKSEMMWCLATEKCQKQCIYMIWKICKCKLAIDSNIIISSLYSLVFIHEHFHLCWQLSCMPPHMQPVLYSEDTEHELVCFGAYILTFYWKMVSSPSHKN